MVDFEDSIIIGAVLIIPVAIAASLYFDPPGRGATPTFVEVCTDSRQTDTKIISTGKVMMSVPVYTCFAYSRTCMVNNEPVDAVQCLVPAAQPRRDQ